MVTSIETAKERNREDKGGWAWQNKAALEIIRSKIEKHAASALVVYSALCELSSDKRDLATFETTHGEIMRKSGIRSDRTVKDRLADLQDLHLIGIKENRISNRMRGPSTYTLLSPIGVH